MTHVLVAVDFSACSRGAFDYAAALARGTQARLTALHVSPYYPNASEWPAAPPPSADPERWMALHEELRELAGRSDDPVPAIVVREGDPAEQILAYAAADETDFIVLGTHGRGRLARWISGSVAERVLHAARRPVVVVPDAPFVPFDRVLCALDLTAGSDDTFACAAAIARDTGAHLIVLHAVPAPPAFEPWMIPPHDDENARRLLSDGARHRLADLLARHACGGLTVEVRVCFGNAHQQIERAARGQVALTVLGVRSSRAAARWLFGSTARHVLRSGASPVLLVPHRAAPGQRHDHEGEVSLVS
jgi:nucleotide-binding universal stress UspA family protein